MQHLKNPLIILSLAVIVLSVTATYCFYSLNKKIEKHEQAIQEIAGVITQGGLVVPDKDGKAMVNPLLLEAWKQANQMP